MTKNLIIEDSNFKINEGERNPTLLSVAESILFRHYQNDDTELNMLKSFFE